MDILEPVVGRNNVKAQVFAEVDFSQTESTSEQHRPTWPRMPARSAASRWWKAMVPCGGTLPTGVPGAASNQPPAPSAAPSTAPIRRCRRQRPATGRTGCGGKRESTINYEVDKTVRVTRGGSGAVKRLSAAVVVNYQSAEDSGQDRDQRSTPEQLEQMTALVRETIGFTGKSAATLSI